MEIEKEVFKRKGPISVDILQREQIHGETTTLIFFICNKQLY